VHNDVSTPKDHGIEYEELRRGSSSGKRDSEVWEETDTFRFETCIIQVQFYFIAGLQRMCIGFSIWLESWLVRK